MPSYIKIVYAYLVVVLWVSWIAAMAINPTPVQLLTFLIAVLCTISYLWLFSE